MKVVGVDEVNGTTFLTTGFSLAAVFSFFLRATVGGASLDLHIGWFRDNFWLKGFFVALLADPTFGRRELLFATITKSAVVSEDLALVLLTDEQVDFGFTRRELGGGIFETAPGA